MAQAILDMFPDTVSQFGLIGCGLTTFIAITAVVLLIASVAEILDR